MNARMLIIRSLLHYWRTGIVVAFGVAIATAVIVGSLVVGDSVKGSIRDTAMARLGSIDYMLVAPHFFRDELAADISHDRKLKDKTRRVVPAVITQGTAENAESGVIVPNVGVVGVDRSFWKLYGDDTANISGRNVAISAALAHDIRATHGDSILVNVDKQSAVPSGTLFEQKSREDTLRSMRLTVAVILPDNGVGGFRVNTGTDAPGNVFVSRDWLTQEIGKEHKSNALLVEAVRGGGNIDLQSALKSSAKLSDYGLKLVPNPKQGYVSLQSEGMLMGNAEVKIAEKAIAASGGLSALTSVYLASTIKKVGESEGIPYSIVAGMQVPSSGISLNTWAAQDLNAKIGDRLEVSYLIPNTDGTYRNGSVTLKLVSIVTLSGPFADRGLVPVFEGITDVERIDEWNAPFPVDLNRIREKDEEYWDKYRATPKAFISLRDAREMWKSASHETNAAWVTSIRATPTAGSGLNTLSRNISRNMLLRMSPENAGMVFRPVRELAVKASSGTTDFGQLFLAMSFFLVIAGAGLAGMLMRLSADQRASEAGIMLASGFDPKTASRILLGEGICLTLLGVIPGVGLGVLYAWLIISALTSWWIGAVGTSALWLHLNAGSLVIGGIAGFVVSMLSVAWGTRKLGRSRVLDLLAGWRSMAMLPKNSSTKRSLVVLVASVIGAAVLLICSIAIGLVPPEGAFFGCGALLLVASLAGVNLALIYALKKSVLPPTIPWLALRSAAANRGRSLLVVGLIASASFIIVTVAANTRDFSRMDFTRRDSGTGGFALRAVSSLPLHYDLGTPSGRANLGFPAEDEKLFKNMQVMSFLVSPGEDISCLNLAKPTQPRVLGVSKDMIRRGGFSIATLESPAGNPWKILTNPGLHNAIPTFGDADSIKWSLHSDIGKNIEMTDQNGKQIDLHFAGLIHGSIFASELLVSEDNFKRIFPGVSNPRYFLISVPSSEASKVAESLRRNLGDMGFDVQPASEVLNLYKSVQNTYLSVFMALGGLGILLGTVGLVAVLLRSALERRREFALMLATGAGTGTLARLLILENTTLLLCGLLCGTISALIAVAPQLVSVESRINWGMMLGELAAIAIVGILSCSVAAGRVVNGSLVKALREE